MTDLLITNARIVDGTTDQPQDAIDLRLAHGRVQEHGHDLKPGENTIVVDARNHYVMPGLIDAHVHVVATTADLKANTALPDPIVTMGAFNIMRAMLNRGFTTVRDLGGATGALKVAFDQSPLPLPRLNICGKALSQTGGHTDQRGPFDATPTNDLQGRLGALGVVCDGVPQVRQAAREQFRTGADFLKIMANGGVSSPSDPIHFLGFSREELIATVEEAANVGSYVAAHLYTDEAIRRAVECGVQSLEHCNLIEPETARFAAESGCIACPTLITFDKLSSEGPDMGLPQASIAKVDDVRLKGLESLSIMSEAGLPMAYGSDLLGGMMPHQSGEFELRAKVLPVKDVIAAATVVAARLLRMEGKIGTLATGAFADVILCRENPLSDISVLSGQGEGLDWIIKGGEVIKGG
ncbi:metal-dependent hydrolase family protein [Hoeflea prorocentri]|uniref:Amidohydrolase family protein n=1 Tax=Hoeflea prorocentri TaxID=1922333 RepID=A0A9X3ZHU1_9HYPH|nr:amidohydrolase family protein [Hoeflea prorocentri]MCY6382197.1 amidohydrolase family protein [Hoeflea prorocentri]MDA5399997.1 amidohydrolase family protein [Hoeflea prorocentri]